MKIVLRHIILALFAVFAYANAAAFVVVIDAGHGGKDPGALGANYKEKDIVLDIALKLGKKIEAQYKDVQVVYTRNSDTYLTLQKRADIANKAKGDLFISIHANSAAPENKSRTRLSGASVFVVGSNASPENLKVAMRENSVIELEKDYTTKYQGFDPKSSESYIMFELTQSAHKKSSIDFAKRALNQLVSTALRANKGVHEAGFLVLWATSMPAVLVELDYICNPTQETFLSSEAGKEKCATALYNAFKNYYTDVKKLQKSSTSNKKQSTKK